MTSEIYKKIGRNSIYNLIRRLVAFPIGIIMPPITIKYIGLEGYGVWVLIQTLITYTSLMDLGFGPAMMKYTAEHDAREEHFEIIQIFNTLFVVYLLLCIVLFVIVLACKGLIMWYLVKSCEIPNETLSFVLIISLLTFCFNMVFSVYPSFLNGLQRMDITNKLGSITSIGTCVFSIFFLCMGGGIKSLAIAGGISCIITSILYVHYGKKIAPYLVFNPFLFSLKTLKSVWEFSAYSAGISLVALIQFQSDKLIICYFLGVKSLAYYEVAQRLIFFIFGFCGSLVTPIMPAISHTHAKYGKDGSCEVFQTLFKYIALIVCPLFLFVTVFADKLIHVWLGAGYENAISVLRLLSIAYLLMILSSPGAQILAGMGFYKVLFYGGIITAIATIFLCLTLTMHLNVFGTAIGILMVSIIGGSYIFFKLQKVFDTLSMSKFLCSSLVFPIVISLSIFSVMYILIECFLVNKYIGLAFACLSLLIGYVLIIYKDRRYQILWKYLSAVRL